jgi:glycosyltransferase involved in cell wall biosynthesis
MKNKILYISSFVPFKSRYAGSNTAAEQLELLLEKYDVDIFSFYSTIEEDYLDEFVRYIPTKGGKIIGLSKVNNFRKIISAIFFLILPALMVSRFSFRLLIHLLFGRKKYEFVHVEFSQAALLGFIASKIANCQLSLSMPDVIFQSYYRKHKSENHILKKYILKIELKKIKIFERFILNKTSFVFVQSYKDKNLLMEVYKLQPDKIFVILPFFNKINVNNIRFNPSKKVIFFAAFNRQENQDAFILYLKLVHPLLKKKYPDYQFLVVGANPSSEMYRLSDIDDSIKITGYLVDVTSVFELASVGVVPLRYGAGIKVKTLEMLYAGLPTIATEVGSEGINDSFGLIREDSIDKFPLWISKIFDGEVQFERSLIRSNFLKNLRNSQDIADILIKKLSDD